MAYTTLYTSEEEKKKKEREAGQTAIQPTGAAAATPAPAQQTTQPAQTVTPQKAAQNNNPYKQYEYDPGTNQAYLDALSALQGVQGNKPTYGATYDDELHALYDQIVGREKFRYNAAEDPMWQNYLEQYTTQGKMAMMDTMGQAAALTGGYGSSYGQMVGQQAYQGYLQEANRNLPQFYNMALDAYTREGDALNQQYAMLGDLQDTEYGRYMDALNQHWNEVNYQQSLADTAYDRGYTNWNNAYQMGVNADNIAYNRQQEAYSKLENLIANTGYMPSAEELSAAGMSEAQAKAWKSYYDRMIAAGSGGSGGGGGGSGSGNDNNDNPDPLTYDDYNKAAASAALGGDIDSLYGTLNQAVSTGIMTERQAASLYNQYEPKASAEILYKTTGGTQQNMSSTEATSTFVNGIKNLGWSKSKGEKTLNQYVADGLLTKAQADSLREKYLK